MCVGCVCVWGGGVAAYRSTDGPVSATTPCRPYLYSSYLLVAACFPYVIVKMILFRYSQDAVPAAAIFIITGLFCWVHVFAARWVESM